MSIPSGNRGGWNHNIHYHGVVLRSVASNCGRALDVGCGRGLLARRLSMRCREVVALDIDHAALVCARTMSAGDGRIAFVEGDVIRQPLRDASFDLVTAVATLHHLPLSGALMRCRDLLKPGGVLAVIGLYRPHRIEDYGCAAAALPASWILRCLHKYEDVGANLREPKETLSEIRSACQDALPGFTLRRRLLFRYSLTWRKP